MAQYQGKGAFSACQGMGAQQATHNIQYEDCWNVAQNGKCNAYGATNVILYNINKIFGNK